MENSNENNPKFAQFILSNHRILKLSLLILPLIAVGLGTRYFYYFRHSLVGEYYSDSSLKDIVFVRRDENINFNWNEGSPAWFFKKDHFSIRWRGFIKTSKFGKYEFITRSDDGVRLWVNNQLVIDDWRGHFATTNKGAVELNEEVVPIVLEYFELDLAASIKLSWIPPGQFHPSIVSPKYFISEKKYLPSSMALDN